MCCPLKDINLYVYGVCEMLKMESRCSGCVPLQTLKLGLRKHSCSPAVLSASNYSTFSETSEEFDLRQ